jgi:hypothetical protein
MRGFHDLLRHKPTSLWILLGWSSISMAFLTIRSMYRVLVARMEVSWNRMRCPESPLCSATADLSRCSRFSLRYSSQPVSIRLTLARVISSTLKMEAIRSSETSVYIKPTRYHIPEDGILHSHRCENLRSYIRYIQFTFASHKLAVGW